MYGKQSDPRGIFIPGAVTKEIRAGEKNFVILAEPGALRIIFTCVRRCSVDGRIRALIKLMQPRATSARLSLVHRCRERALAHAHLYAIARIHFYERYTLWKQWHRVPTRDAELPAASYEHVSRRLVRRKIPWAVLMPSIRRFQRKRNILDDCRTSRLTFPISVA